MGFSLKKLGNKISSNFSSFGSTGFGKMLGMNDSFGAMTDPIGFLTGENQMNAQNEWNLKMWNLQNAYNTPSAQMQRFAEAGLNPNLIYGQTNTAGPVHASAGAPSGVDSISKAFSTVASILSFKQLGAQIANLKQQNQNLKAQDTLLESQSEYVGEQARKLRLENMYFQNTGRLPRSEGALGVSMGDFFRYMDWLTPNIESSSGPSIHDVSMFNLWYNSMMRRFEERVSRRVPQKKEGVYIKSRW